MIVSEKFFSKKNTLIGITIILFLMLCLAYSNHFTNGFQFDDIFSIVNNSYIHDIKNISLFFTDVRCFGTNMNDLGYRPIVALLNAVSYWLASGLNPIYFHASIFFWYLVQLVLMFFVFKKIFELSLTNINTNYIKLLAVIAVGFYAVHAANAETINYMISISDSFSTLCIVASLLLYMLPKTRKYYLYLFTIALAIGTKETGAMAGPIIFIYILLLEENISIFEVVTFKKTKNLYNTFKKALPALIVSFGLFFIIREVFIPEELGIVSSDLQVSRWAYFYTQWVVIVHYLSNFILPLNLSVDHDFEVYNSILNHKILLSLALLLTLMLIAFKSSSKKETAPIAFGILWFFIALAPTSTIIPFSQVSNDHRTFFPYIGLVISLSWYIFLLIKKHRDYLNEHLFIKNGISVLFLSIISLQAYGTYQRCHVWSSSELLWGDAVIKGPNNGRSQMNYGLTLMEKGKYEEALPYFQKAIVLLPYWANSNINMAILKNAMGKPEEAEMYFKNAIRYQALNPQGYHYYGRWLNQVGRVDEAIAQLEAGNKVSPAYGPINELLNTIKTTVTLTPAEKLKNAKADVEQNPTSDKYINLSVLYYQNSQFKECIESCEKALKLQPSNSLAYSNICAAYCSVSEWEKAAAACDKALAIDPNFEMAKNNLNWAKGNIK